MSKLNIPRDRIAKKLWMICLLSYSFALLALLAPGAPSLPAFFLVPFYLFVPGYAMTKLFFRDLGVFERVLLSVGLSVALFLGFKSLIRTFGLEGLLMELPVLVAISAVSLVAEIISSR